VASLPFASAASGRSPCLASVSFLSTLADHGPRLNRFYVDRVVIPNPFWKQIVRKIKSPKSVVETTQDGGFD